MDAFLRPSTDTDTSGVPLRLKTIQFYKDVQKKLAPDGLVAFNIHAHEKVTDDLKNVHDAFAQNVRLPPVERPRLRGDGIDGEEAQRHPGAARHGRGAGHAVQDRLLRSARWWSGWRRRIFAGQTLTRVRSPECRLWQTWQIPSEFGMFAKSPVTDKLSLPHRTRIVHKWKGEPPEDPARECGINRLTGSVAIRFAFPRSWQGPWLLRG